MPDLTRFLPTRPSRRAVNMIDPSPITSAAFPSGHIPRGRAASSDSRAADAWKVWRTLGEVHYSTTFMARQVGRLGWKITLDGVEQEQEVADEMVGLVTDGKPARHIRTMALHHQVAGQYLYVRDRETGSWQVLSTASVTKRRGWQDELQETVDVLIHTINRDPENPQKADSPVMAALGTAEELLLLSRMSRAQTKNRVAQRGMLLYPQELMWPDGFDFDDELERVMTAPLTDEGHASSVVPPRIPVPGAMIEQWRHLLLESDFDESLQEKIDAAIRRLALQLDHPPEVLLGLADVTHWNAWHTDEATYRAHVQPMAEAPADTLAQAILLGAGLDEDTVVEVEPDPSELLKRRPTISDAFQAFDRGAVSIDYLIDVLGASPEDRPEETEQTPRERAVDVALSLVRGAPALATDLIGLVRQIEHVLSGGPLEASDPIEPAAPSAGGGADDPPQSQEQPRQGDVGEPSPSTAAVPTDELELLGDRLTAIDHHILSSLRGASELAVHRVRERIGARIRTLIQKDAALSDKIDGIDNADVAATLGQEIYGPLDDWTATAEDTLQPFIRLWQSTVDEAVVSMQTLGVEVDVEARQPHIDRATGLLEGLMVDYTIGTLDRTTAAMLAPPQDAVRRAMAVAGGSEDPVLASLGRPELSDPGLFATSRDTLRELQQQGVQATQWRWSYGPQPREQPDPVHRANDGRFAGVDGAIDGRYPGDHINCGCALTLVFTDEGSVGQLPDDFPDRF